MRLAETPLIIEASLNGVVTKKQNPNVPYSDEEIVEQAIACMEAGAALIHNHTEDPVFGGPGYMDAERYASAWRKLLKIRPDAILTPTMPGDPEGTPVETRYSHIVKMAEEGLIAQGLVDSGSVNMSALNKEGLFHPTTRVYRNDARDSQYYVETCRKLKLGMSVSIFEPGFLRYVMAYHKAGKLPRGGILKLYFGAENMSFGLPPTAKGLEAYLEMIGDSGLPWLVSNFGGDCVKCGIAEEAIKRGGHVQVGIEPYGGPRTPTNLELVNEVVEIAKHYNRPLATPEQAAEILKLPTYPAPYGQSGNL